VPDEEPTNADGRRARRDRNKYAVVDAYLDLVRAGNSRPSIADVAEHSGVSHRSVFRYFADKDELARTAIERQQAVARPVAMLTVGPGAPLDERIEKFVDRRLELYEVIAPVARLSRSLVSIQPLIAAELTSTRQQLRGQIEHLFRAELEALGDDGPDALAAVDVVCSFESVELLLHDMNRSSADTAAVLRRSIDRLLTLR
jgi:AcrR family transcriptional regulator